MGQREEEFVQTFSFAICFNSMTTAPTYYETLEVCTTATRVDIMKSYKKLAMKYHPDKHSTLEDRLLTTPKFQALTEAFTVLNDDEKRAAYDRELKIKHLWTNPPSESSHASESTVIDEETNLQEITNWIASTLKRYAPSMKETLNEYRQLGVSLTDCVFGATKYLCIPNHKIRCDDCLGTGRIQASAQSKSKPLHIGESLLNILLTQRIHADVCSNCEGQGIVSANSCTFAVTIEPGQKPGDQIILSGKGTANRSLLGLAGDIIVTLVDEIDDKSHFKRHPDKRYPFDLITRKEISLKEALLGFTLTIMPIHPSCSPVHVQSEPSRVYKQGDSIIISNGGLPHASKNPLLCGDMHLVLDVRMPTAEDIVFARGLLSVLLP